jgi:hypothetical protein
MKIYALVMTAGVALAGIAGPSLAFENSTSAVLAPLSKIDGSGHSDGLIQTISCDIRDEDKQAMCMRACDDEWIKATQAYNANIDEAKGVKKACEKKCGC